MPEPQISTNLTSFEDIHSETSVVEALQRQHEKLLRESAEENEIDVSSVTDFLRSLADAGTFIRNPNYRSQLRTLILYWSNFVRNKTSTFPLIQLKPFNEYIEAKSELLESAVSQSDLENVQQATRELNQPEISSRTNPAHVVMKKSVEADTTNFFEKAILNQQDLLSKYYTSTKTSNNNIFRASIIVSFIGLLMIGFGTASMFIFPTSFSYIAIGGLIVELIASSFFYLYWRSIQQLESLQNKILNLQSIMISIKALQEIDNEEKRNELLTDAVNKLLSAGITISNEEESVSNNELERSPSLSFEEVFHYFIDIFKKHPNNDRKKDFIDFHGQLLLYIDNIFLKNLPHSKFSRIIKLSFILLVLLSFITFALGWVFAFDPFWGKFFALVLLIILILTCIILLIIAFLYMKSLFTFTERLL